MIRASKVPTKWEQYTQQLLLYEINTVLCGTVLPFRTSAVGWP